MIKLNGISILDFVLELDTTTLQEFLNSVRPDDYKSFVLTTLLLEDTIDNATEMIPPSVLEYYNLTHNQYIKHKRYYLDNKGTDAGIILSKEKFEELNNSSIFLPKRFDTDGLSPNQVDLAGQVFLTLVSNYKQGNFHQILNEYIHNDVSYSLLFNGINFTSYVNVMETYGDIPYSINISKELIKVKQLHNLLTLKQLDFKELEEEVDRILNSTTSLKYITEACSLPPTTTFDELDLVLIRLAESGFPGIDLYKFIPENRKYGDINIPTSETKLANIREAYILLYEDMLSRTFKFVR